MLNNLNLLYIIFLCTLLNIGFFLYRKDFQSILIFIVCCIVIYMVNKNMILILGFSILFVNALGIVRMFKKEGFKNDESEDEDIKENMKDIDSDNESDNDSENDYMQDKEVIKKIKKMNPKILKTLNKLNSIDIKEINTYINTLKDVIDP